MAGRLARSQIWSLHASPACRPRSCPPIGRDPASPQAAHLAGVDRRDAVVNDDRVGAHAALGVVDRRAQPAAMAMAADRYLRKVRGQLLGHFIRGIVRAVVDDQHAELATSARWRARGFRERFFAAAFRHCKRAARRSRTYLTRYLRMRASERACLLRQLSVRHSSPSANSTLDCSFTQKSSFARAVPLRTCDAAIMRAAR